MQPMLSRRGEGTHDTHAIFIFRIDDEFSS